MKLENINNLKTKYNNFEKIIDNETNIPIYMFNDFEIINNNSDNNLEELIIDYPVFIYNISEFPSFYHEIMDILGSFLFISSNIKNEKIIPFPIYIYDKVDENLILNHFENKNLFTLNFYNKIYDHKKIFVLQNYKKIYFKKLYTMSFNIKIDNKYNERCYEEFGINQIYILKASKLIKNFIQQHYSISKIEKDKKIYMLSKVEKVVEDVAKYMGSDFLVTKTNINSIHPKIKKDDVEQVLDRIVTKNQLDKLLHFFTKIGYTIFDPSTETLENQISIISSASAIVTFSGSNSMHAIYANENCQFVTINLNMNYIFEHDIILKQFNKNIHLIFDHTNMLNKNKLFSISNFISEFKKLNLI